jgi:hypothetical protein
MNEICAPTDHNFKMGGEGGSSGDERWEAWLFCGSCCAIGMVPEDANSGVKNNGQSA